MISDKDDQDDFNAERYDSNDPYYFDFDSDPGEPVFFNEDEMMSCYDLSYFPEGGGDEQDDISSTPLAREESISHSNFDDSLNSTNEVSPKDDRRVNGPSSDLITFNLKKQDALSSQLCSTTKFEKAQFISVPNDLFMGRQRAPKRKVNMPKIALDFRKAYYGTFTTKKCFKKKYIKQIHNEFLTKFLDLKQMARDEIRMKDLYFLNYSTKMNEILECLKDNKDDILCTILKDLPNKIL